MPNLLQMTIVVRLHHAIADGIALLTYLFGDGPAPTAPGPQDCGLVPVERWRAPVALSCESYTSCAR